MRLFIAICVLIFVGCTKSNEDLPAGIQYYPNADLLEKGIVFKYYYHRGKKVSQTKTDIVYRKMKLQGNTIINEDYNAGFQKSYFHKLEIDGTKWRSIEEKSYDYRNVHKVLFREFNYTIKDNVHTDWKGNDAYLTKKVMNEGYGSRVEQTQTSATDSIIDGKAIKEVFGKQLFYSIIDNEENDPIELSTFKKYEQGLGLTKSVMSTDELNFELALDEIMSLKEFERRANHGTHRVAYIDTLKTIDDYTLFRPCFHPDKINDYYNDQRSEFKGGKGRLRAILAEKLDHSKIKDESGYLTYRFVINCEGEAGWFVTEEADLDYQKKNFSEDCKMHLYKILKAEKGWKNLEVYDEARDAYTYITFKIKNGEIIEILP